MGLGRRDRSSPGGTTETWPHPHREFFRPFRPCGTSRLPTLSPAINRRAIVGCPCGTLARTRVTSAGPRARKDRLYFFSKQRETHRSEIPFAVRVLRLSENFKRIARGTVATALFPRPELSLLQNRDCPPNRALSLPNGNQGLLVIFDQLKP